MSKAINWPSQFLNEVINENNEDLRVAFRLGSVYYDHCYYVNDDIVDIRVNHKVIRQGLIVGDLKLCKICEITDDDLKKHKMPVQSIDNLISYLSKNYNEDANSQTLVTVVYYKNIGSQKSSERLDDPHM